MSIQFDTSTDHLDATLTAPLTVGTGDISCGYWMYPSSTNNAWRSIQIMCKPDATQVFGTYASPGSNTVFSNSNQGNGGTYNLSNTTWYYIVVSRASGTTIRFRVFDDSTSTTPLFNDTVGCTVNYNALTNLFFGNRGGGFDPAALVELASYKIYTGAEWSNAECRLESQKFDIQKSGGTERLAWGFETTAADAFGLLERNGGDAFTNTGAVNGANRPTQLESTGSIGPSLPTYNRTQFSPNGRPIRIGLGQQNTVSILYPS